MVEVKVTLERPVGLGEPADVEHLIARGAPDEPFREALNRVTARGFRWGCVEIGERGPEGRAVLRVDDRVTLGEVAGFADGDALFITTIGRGGSLIPTLWELVKAGMDIGAVVGLLRMSYAVLQARIYAEPRREARRWTITGTDSEPSPELAGHVRAEVGWSLHDMRNKFGLDEADAAALLRKLGYECTDPKMHYWQERPEE